MIQYKAQFTRESIKLQSYRSMTFQRDENYFNGT